MIDGLLIILAYFENLSLPLVGNSERWLFLLSGIVVVVGLRKLRGSWSAVILSCLILLGFVSVVAAGNFESGARAGEAWVTGLLLFLIFGSRANSLNRMGWWNWLNLTAVIWVIVLLVNPSLGWGLISKIMTGGDVEMKMMEWGRGRLLPVGAIYMTVLIPLFSGKFGWLLVLGGLISVVLSGYRSMFLAVGVGLLLLIGISRRLSVVLMLLSVFFLMLIGRMSENSMWQRILMQDTEDRRTLLARRDYLLDAWRYFGESPIFGIGWGNFSVYSSPMLVGNKDDPEAVVMEMPGSPHSQSVLWLTEAGIGGLLFYLMWLFNFGVDDWKRWSRTNDNRIKLLVISSWMYVIGSWLDAYPTYGLLTFCIIRGMLESAYASSNSA